jgi:hypothetical protein
MLGDDDSDHHAKEVKEETITSRLPLIGLVIHLCHAIA